MVGGGFGYRYSCYCRRRGRFEFDPFRILQKPCFAIVSVPPECGKGTTIAAMSMESCNYDCCCLCCVFARCPDHAHCGTQSYHHHSHPNASTCSARPSSPQRTRSCTWHNARRGAPSGAWTTLPRARRAFAKGSVCTCTCNIAIHRSHWWRTTRAPMPALLSTFFGGPLQEAWREDGPDRQED